MTNKRGINDDANEELPDEYEVIQHSLRDNSDKAQQDITPVKQNTGIHKPDGSRLDKADLLSNRGAEKNKRR